MKRISFIIAAALVLLVAVSCKKEGEGDSPKNSVSVVVAGYFYNPAKPNPCVWVDGEFSPLSLGVENDAGFTYSICSDASGNYYVAGYIQRPSSPTTACYWKNGGEPVILGGADGSYSYAYAIALDKKGKTIVGGSTDNIPCYWHDGVRVDLEYGGSITGAVYGVTVDGNDIYALAGLYNNDISKDVVVVYKNGTRFCTVMQADQLLEPYGIYVDDGHIYTTIYREYGGANNEVGVYCEATGYLYKDSGLKCAYNKVYYNSVGRNLVKYNGKFLVPISFMPSSSSNCAAGYWCEDELKLLTDFSEDSYMTALGVDGKDLYALTTTYGSTPQRTIWKNGERMYTLDPAPEGSFYGAMNICLGSVRQKK